MFQKGTPVSCDRLTLHSHGFFVGEFLDEHFEVRTSQVSIPNIGDECPRCLRVLESHAQGLNMISMMGNHQLHDM